MTGATRRITTDILDHRQLVDRQSASRSGSKSNGVENHRPGKDESSLSTHRAMFRTSTITVTALTDRSETRRSTPRRSCSGCPSPDGEEHEIAIRRDVRESKGPLAVF